MTKDKDRTILREYAMICRVLMGCLCIGYIITGIVLVLVIFTNVSGSGVPGKTDMDNMSMRADSSDQEFAVESQAHYYMITFESLVAGVLCALFLTSTFNGNLWLTVPYFFMHSILIFYTFLLLIVEVQTTWKHYRKHQAHGHWEAFGKHVFHHKGAASIFTGILVIFLLIFALVPILKFMDECRVRRRDKMAEERQKQKRIEFQFGEDRVESEKAETDTTVSSSTTAPPSPSRRTSSDFQMIRRETSVTPEREREKRKSMHGGHRKHYY